MAYFDRNEDREARVELKHKNRRAAALWGSYYYICAKIASRLGDDEGALMFLGRADVMPGISPQQMQKNDQLRREVGMPG